VEWKLLSIGTKMLEYMLVRVEPSAGSDGAYSHAGEEFIYVLKASLEKLVRRIGVPRLARTRRR
jgi:hypothetical protein